jgi:hypothetical protein
VNTKALNAVEHLNKILPLVARHQDLSTETKSVYQKRLSSHVELGKTLNKNEVSALFNAADIMSILNIYILYKEHIT